MYLYRVNGFILMLYSPALIVWALKEALLPQELLSEVLLQDCLCQKKK